VKRLDKVWVQYNADGTEVDPTPTLTVASEITGASSTQNINFAHTGGISVHSATANYSIPGRSHRISMSGVGKPKILAIRAQVVVTEGRLGVDTPAET
jgi:hypothetical protein